MQKMMMRDVVTRKLAGLRKVHCQITMRWLTFQPNPPPTFIVVCLFELIHYSNHIFLFAAQRGIPYIFQIISDMFKKGSNSKMFPICFTFNIQLTHYQYLIIDN